MAKKRKKKSGSGLLESARGAGKSGFGWIGKTGKKAKRRKKRKNKWSFENL
jgi:hypothetical protein